MSSANDVPAAVDTSPVDDALARFVAEAMQDYVRRNPSDPYASAALTIDQRRLARSLQWLSRLALDGRRILELGGPGIASHVIQSRFPGGEYVNTDFDLRDTFPYADASFDVVIGMEVIEHICDIRYAHATTLSGVKQCLAECRRVLRPRGRMFLTTPNAASIWVIQRALLQQPPWLYEWHFREFTIAELRSLLEEAGFQIVEARAENVWHLWNFGPILRFMKQQGHSLKDRGDDIFVICAPAESRVDTASAPLRPPSDP